VGRHLRPGVGGVKARRRPSAGGNRYFLRRGAGPPAACSGLSLRVHLSACAHSST